MFQIPESIPVKLLIFQTGDPFLISSFLESIFFVLFCLVFLVFFSPQKKRQNSGLRKRQSFAVLLTENLTLNATLYEKMHLGHKRKLGFF